MGIKTFSRTLLVVASAVVSGHAQAKGADGTPSGGSGSVHVKGEATAYRISTPKSPVSLQVKGSGELSVKIRGVLPAGGSATEGAKVRVVDNGQELAHFSPSLFPNGGFSDRSDVVPSGASSRTFKLGDGPHSVTFETKGANAAISIQWKGKNKPGSRHEAVAVKSRGPQPSAPIKPPPQLAPDESEAPPPAEPQPVEPAPAPEAAPQTVASANASPPPLGSLTPAPLPTQAEGGQAPAPVQPAAVAQPASTVTVSTESSSRSPVPLILVGGAFLCAAGSATSVILAVNQNSTYVSSPEVQGGTSTLRDNMLRRANNELGVGEVLGGVAAAFLLAAGISLFF